MTDLFLISNTITITAAVMLAVFLFTTANHYGSTNWRYVSLYHALACAGLIDAAITITETVLEYYGIALYWLHFHLLPVGMFAIMELTIMAVFRIMHGTQRERRRLMLMAVVFWSIVGLLPYFYRFHSPYVHLLTPLYFAVGFTFVITAFLAIVRGYRRWKSLLYTYLSEDLADIRRKCFVWLCFCLLYVVLTFVELTVPNTLVHFIFCYLRIICYLIIALMVFTNHELLQSLERAFLAIRRRNVTPADAVAVLHNDELQLAKTRLEQWAKRTDQPYLRRGITVQDVAVDAELPVELIIQYCFAVNDTSFRGWIRSLRQAATEDQK